MRVLVTGAAGFLGRRLARALLSRGRLAGQDGMPRAISDLVLVDRTPLDVPTPCAFPIRTMVGDLAQPHFVDELARTDFDTLFHLAATLTLEAERDPGLAFAANVEPLRRLSVAGRATKPKIVFTSSIAVFGGALPAIVDDAVRPAPTTTYGAHKAIVELLLADATRQGRIDGRALRLPIVVTRPGAPVPAVSDQVAAILREPLAGRDYDCPFRSDTRLCLASAGAVVRALLSLHDVPAERLAPTRAMNLPALNLPALSVTVAEMVAAVKMAAPGRCGRVRFTPDASVQAIVDGWPQRFESEAARGLGLRADTDLAALIADHLEDRGIADAEP